jgi:hypothetical protein
MVASHFWNGISGCLSLSECFKVVALREEGRALLLSPEYIAGQIVHIARGFVKIRTCEFTKQFGAAYAKAGLPRPVVTKAGIVACYGGPISEQLEKRLGDALDVFFGAYVNAHDDATTRIHS